MSIMSERLEWTETSEHHYEARRDQRKYVASREPNEGWCVVSSHAHRRHHR
jgi:hypothetical protein